MILVLKAPTGQQIGARVDKVTDEQILKTAARDYPNALFVSATKGIRLENLKKKLIKKFN